VITSDLDPALSSPSSLRFDAIAPKPKAKADRRGRIISASLKIYVKNLPAPIRKAKSGRQAFPPH